ncbi:hypothetical protein CEUSTIGMA_g2728.t1 [Chlamydomonas eustigma]|uniref:NADH-ubiquinone oxidoreductase 21kDa subunit N-terminal domain-containing protein n=1 Tax=Chlamydomonas eustigma TaxID=1157962 RepID=A0A250WWQ6_9CHLO|nr:hypothetical protein CEUSTIGMA_g2728.t1 [Chlamydomonas eustigma]|eukprot:GAX75283.1 hypothetical protein CEUSTIGMA_g2728.t1 [Chlamydomonas eustigma]
MSNPWPDPPNYYETPSKSYKVMLQQPGFPVIYPEPTITQVVSNFRPSHWGFVAGMAGLGYVLGYWKGSVIHWQKPASMFGTLFMGQFGVMHMMQDSAYRLMGFKENSIEVRSNMPGALAKEAY